MVQLFLNSIYRMKRKKLKLKLELEFLRFHYLALRCFGFVAFIYSATVREIKLLLVKQIKYKIMCQIFFININCYTFKIKLNCNHKLALHT